MVSFQFTYKIVGMNNDAMFKKVSIHTPLYLKKGD